MNNEVSIIMCKQQQEPQEIVIAPAAGETINQVLVLAGISGSYAITVRVPQHAHATLLLLPLLRENQQLDLHILQEHATSNASSSVYVYGALAGHACITCYCKTSVSQSIRHVQTIQKSSFWLLSPQASVKTVPAFAAMSRDVKCQHGAAIGTFDADQLSQLSMRGIPQHRAKQLLLDGFFVQGMAHVGIDQMPKQIEFAIKNLLPKL